MTQECARILGIVIRCAGSTSRRPSKNAGRGFKTGVREKSGQKSGAPIWGPLIEVQGWS